MPRFFNPHNFLLKMIFQDLFDRLREHQNFQRFQSYVILPHQEILKTLFL